MKMTPQFPAPNRRLHSKIPANRSRRVVGDYVPSSNILAPVLTTLVPLAIIAAVAYYRKP